MKRKIIIAIIIISAIIVFLFFYRFSGSIISIIVEEYQKKDLIYWYDTNTIKYSDFKDSPKYNYDADIGYFHGFVIEGNNIETTAIFAIFDKSRSWVKDTTKYNFQLELKKQKLLFDLTEVYSRKFNLRINRLRNGNSRLDTIEYSDILEVRDKILKEHRETVDEIYYFSDSIPKILAVWRPKIDQKLKRYHIIYK